MQGPRSDEGCPTRFGRLRADSEHPLRTSEGVLEAVGAAGRTGGLEHGGLGGDAARVPAVA